MIIALKAKDKLGLINGKCIVSYESLEKYETRLKVDSMVTSWILNKGLTKIFPVRNLCQTTMGRDTRKVRK